MRAERLCLGLACLLGSVMAPAAPPDARESFLQAPDLAHAHAAWAELDRLNRVDDLMAPYGAAQALYPLDELTPSACTREVPKIRAALQRNPLAAPPLLALAMCAEQRGDAVDAAHWRLALEAWLQWSFADQRGGQAARPAAVVSPQDIEGLALAAGLDWEDALWRWGGPTGDALVVEVDAQDAAGQLRPLYFDLSQRFLHLLPTRLSQAQQRTQVRELLRQYARPYPLARALQLFDTPLRREADIIELRGIAAQAPRVAIRWLQHCAQTTPFSCLPADLDPVLAAAEAGNTRALLALLWHEALVPAPATADADAVAVLWQALMRRLGADEALTWVWDTRAATTGSPVLPAPVVTLLRRQAERKDPLSLYRLALAPQDANDQTQAGPRLEAAMRAGLPQAQVLWARQQLFADPPPRDARVQAQVRAVLEHAAAQGLADASIYLEVARAARAAPATQDAVYTRLQQQATDLPADLALWSARHALRRGRPAEAMPPVLRALKEGTVAERVAALDVLHTLVERDQKPPAGWRVEPQLFELPIPAEVLERYCAAGHWAGACLQRFVLEAGTQAQGHAGPAGRWLQRAVDLGSPHAQSELGSRLVQYGDTAHDLQRGLGLLDRAAGMGLPVAMNNAAWFRCITQGMDARQRALGLRMVESIAEPDLASLDTLAACQAANGDFATAVSTQQRVLDDYLQRTPESTRRPQTLTGFRTRLALYQREQVWLEHRGVPVTAEP